MPTKSATGDTGGSASETDLGTDAETGAAGLPTGEAPEGDPNVEPAMPERDPEPEMLDGVIEEPAMPEGFEAGEPSFPEPPVIDAVIEEPVLADPVEPATEAEPAPEPTYAASPPPVHAAGDSDDLHDGEEEGGSSLAAKALTALVLLLVGAGVGIWAAPRVAPMLPSGMAPVADWLTPGSAEADAAIAALQTRLDQGLTDVRASVAAIPAPVDGEAAARGVEERLTGEIATLKQALDGADVTAITQRLATLEAGLQGEAAELASLKEQLTGATASGSDASGIDVYRGELDNVRAEVAALRDQVSGFTARVDQVAADANRQVETAQTQVASIQAETQTQLSAADAQANLALVDAALSGGQPFQDALDKLSGQPGISIPEGLAAAAPTGVATLSSLRDSFGDEAHAAIRASVLSTAAGQGVLARARAFVEAQVASRSLTPQAGAGTDAVLSRMEQKLQQDDLDGAISEAGQLPSEAAAAMATWLDAAKLRAGALAGYAELDHALGATN